MNAVRSFASLAMLLVLTVPAAARIRPVWTYDDLTKQSDLIVIAAPVAVKDTGEKTTIPNVAAGNSPIPAIVMETRFEALAILKGEGSKEKPTSLVVCHLRKEANQAPARGEPELISFDPEKQNRYLLFLKRDADGRYSAVVGQTDPAEAVKDLGTDPSN
jgi:hypothetical protein